MFAYLRVCICACGLSPPERLDSGPIWLNLFLLAPSLSLGGFRQKNLDTGFPPFLHIYSKYFLAKIFEYKILKNA